MEEKSLSYFLTEVQKIVSVNTKKKIKIALLSSFTLNGLPEVLKVKCNQKDIDCEVFLGGYNQYSQEILN